MLFDCIEDLLEACGNDLSFWTGKQWLYHQHTCRENSVLGWVWVKWGERMDPWSTPGEMR